MLPTIYQNSRQKINTKIAQGDTIRSLGNYSTRYVIIKFDKEYIISCKVFNLQILVGDFLSGRISKKIECLDFSFEEKGYLWKVFCIEIKRPHISKGKE